MGKKILVCLLIFTLSVTTVFGAERPEDLIDAVETMAEGVSEEQKKELGLTCKAYVLMDIDSGNVLCEKEATEELAMASITKIMTILLIMEALDDGGITYDTMIPVSAHAASMGGSQVYLEEGEHLSVKDMLKCICIASANDASVAMAEYLGGSEEAFVAQMNRRAKELGMNNTNFVNSYGLDTDGHYSCAKDIALMSAELMKCHPEISKFTTTWMDSIVHHTARGSKEFGLSNTNRLIKSYKGITGLKTGSTGKALYCLSATAERDGCKLVAVVMAAPEPKTRFAEAARLLDYGFANYHHYEDTESKHEQFRVSVAGSMDGFVNGVVTEPFGILLPNDGGNTEVTRKVMLSDQKAPVKAGATVGELRYYCGEIMIGSVSIVAAYDVSKGTYADYIGKLLEIFF